MRSFLFEDLKQKNDDRLRYEDRPRHEGLRQHEYRRRTERKLVCLGTGTEIDDDGYVLSNPASAKPALLRTIYRNKAFRVREHLPGIFRFADWLPIDGMLECEGYPITYRSEGLASVLGLNRLYITFSGYWPEKGALMATGTFKECEAYAVCARFPANSEKTLVVASAGNTARAFIKVASENRIPLVAVVPQNCLVELWSDRQADECVKIVAVGGECDYFDAIRLAESISEIDGYQSEGGAKNVARRDGMGTTVLSAAAFIGEIPEFYFQSIGSGTGAIAAYEASLRLIESGQFTNTEKQQDRDSKKRMNLQISQNSPFLPIYNAWRHRVRDVENLDASEARELIRRMDAKVLSNRKPPYGITGGLYDALAETDGDVFAVTNDEARAAQRLFFKTEGCDICPEAGVALSSLISKLRSGIITKDSVIMLNITGGGIETLKSRPGTTIPEPAIVIDIAELDGRKDLLQEKIRRIMGL